MPEDLYLDKSCRSITSNQEHDHLKYNYQADNIRSLNKELRFES